MVVRKYCLLLENYTPSDNITTVVVNGQTLVSSVANPTKKRKIAWDVQSWSQAFSMYASALISANSTTKPESASLLAHMFSVLQLEKTWVAANGMGYSKNQGSENYILSMHGFSAKSITYRPTARVRSKRRFILRDLGMSGMELQEGVQKSGCRFSCSCYFCGGPHRGPNCLSRLWSIGWRDQTHHY